MNHEQTPCGSYGYLSRATSFGSMPALNRCAFVLAIATLMVFSSRGAVAQTRPSQVEAVRDDAYAARLAIEEFAEEIRAGNTKGVPDAALAAAFRGLFTAANERRVPKPPVPAPAMWDFRIDVTEANATADGIVDMRVRVHLAVERDAGEPIPIRLNREEGRWRIAEPAALVTRVAQMHRRLTLRKGAR